MQITYNIQFFPIGQPNGVIKDQIVQRDIASDISFTGSKNNGPGNLNILTNRKVVNNNVEEGDIIKVFLFSDRNKNGQLVYFGTVNEIVRTRENKKEEYKDTIEYKCLHVKNLLDAIVYKDGTNPTFTKTDTAKSILQDILTYFGFFYPNTVVEGNVVPYPLGELEKTISVEFDEDDCFSAIKKVHDITGHIFYITPDGELNSFPDPRGFVGDQVLGTQDDNFITTEANELLLLEGPSIGASQYSVRENFDINTIQRRKTRVYDIVNTLYLTYNGGQKTYTDAASVTEYGTREEYLDRSSDIGNEATADDFAESYFTENANPRDVINVEIFNTVDVFAIRPGDVLLINNSEVEYPSVVVEKITYDVNGARIQTGKLISASFAVNPQ